MGKHQDLLQRFRRVVNNLRLGRHPIRQQIVKHLYTKESLKELKAWFLQGRRVVIEYEDERTFINGDKKVCLNASGKILWATNTGEDPEEKRNVACGRELNGKQWVKLINWVPILG